MISQLFQHRFFQPSSILGLTVRHSSKKSGGSTSNGRSSNPKFLGFKKGHNSIVEAGNIIIRQRGTRWHPGQDVGIGRDHTLFALQPGRVVLHFDLARQKRIISIDQSNSLTHSKSFLPSKTAMKQRLRDMVDIPVYLSLDAKERYDHVFERVAILNEQLKKEQEAEREQILMQKGQRQFHLVDLTRL